MLSASEYAVPHTLNKGFWGAPRRRRYRRRTDMIKQSQRLHFLIVLILRSAKMSLSLQKMLTECQIPGRLGSSSRPHRSPRDHITVSSPLAPFGARGRGVGLDLTRGGARSACFARGLSHSISYSGISLQGL